MTETTGELGKGTNSPQSSAQTAGPLRGKRRRKLLWRAAAEAGLAVLSLGHDGLSTLGAVGIGLQTLKALHPELAAEQAFQDLEMDIGFVAYVACDAIARFNCALGRLEPEELDVCSVVERILGRCEQYYMDADLAPRMRLTASFNGNSSAHVDPAALERALLNLSTNSIRAVQNALRGGQLTLGEIRWLGCANAPVDRAVIAISDNGGGIPRRVLRRLGRPFVTTKKRPLSGLGMYSTLRCVALMGGSISVASSTKPVGSFPAGTVFTLALPATPERVADRAAYHAPRLAVINDYRAYLEWLNTNSF